MKIIRRVAVTAVAASLGAGGVAIATAGAAHAAPDCLAGGIGRYVNEQGVVEIGNDPRCGEIYRYDEPYTPVPQPQPETPVQLGPDGCLGGLVGDIACNRSQEDWTVPHPIWHTPPGGLPQIIGHAHPDGTVTVGEPEPVPEGHVEVGEPETVGIGGGGSWGGGGGFFFGGGSIGSSGNVSIGDLENVETQAE